MHRLHVDDEGHRRPREFRQARDFADLVHAHLDDPDAGCGIAIAQRQRHAPEIVEAGGAGERLGIGGDEFLCGRLAGAAGETDDGTAVARPRGAAERPKAVDQCVLDDELRNADAFNAVRHDHRDRAGGLRIGRELPAVALAGEARDKAAARRAGQCDEQAAGLHEPAVLRDEIDWRVGEPFRQAKRTGDFCDRP